MSQVLANKNIKMKIQNQIIVLIIFIALVFGIKSDYKKIYSRTVSYLKSEIGNSSIVSKGQVIDDVKNSVSEAIKQTSENIASGTIKKTVTVKTPGALVVPEVYLTNNTKSINLTISGVIKITNAERASNGNLSPLKENSKLNFSAEKKLQDMFAKQYFEHNSPSGVGVGDLGQQVGYEYIMIGENLALGNFKDDQALVNAWMASPGHRANILNAKYTEIGVAVGRGTYEGKTVWMAVQHFGLPKSACPSIDEVLHGKIDIGQSEIKSVERELSLRKSKIESGVVYEGLTTKDQITKYNLLVITYNKLIAEVKEQINKYNEEVRSFNSCIAQ